MEFLGQPDGPAPQVGDRVIRLDGPDFVPGRVCEISPSGRMVSVEFPGGGSLFAPAAGFLVVPDGYLPPPPRRLSEAQQVELMYDGEIPAGLLDAASKRDTAPEALGARRAAAAEYLDWLSTHLHPLDPARFVEPLAHARALSVAATAATMAALMAAA